MHSQQNIKKIRLGYYAALEWLFVTDVPGQSINPIFKGQEIQKKVQSMPEVN